MQKRQTKPSSLKKAPLLTRRALAAVMGCHMQTITGWEQEGMPLAHRGGRGRPNLYDEVEVRAWKQLRDETAARLPELANPAAARARRELAQAALAEQAHRIRSRELVPASEVEKIWAREVAATRAVLLNWTATLADLLHRAAITDGVPGVEGVLQTAIYDVLRQLSTVEGPAAP
jgi:hypothetical protein